MVTTMRIQSSMHASFSGRRHVAARWHHTQPHCDRQRISKSTCILATAAVQDTQSSKVQQEDDIKARHRAVMREANRSRANLPSALASLEQLLETQPTNAHLLVSKGVLCSRMGNAEAADAAFAAAAEHASSDDGAVFQVGAVTMHALVNSFMVVEHHVLSMP